MSRFCPLVLAICARLLLIAAIGVTVSGCAPAPFIRSVTPQTTPALRPVPRSPGPVRAARIHPPAVPLSSLTGWKPRGAEFEYARRHPHEVALTFDAGASATGVPLILAALESHHVRATFFLTGNFCREFPGQAHSIAEAGMELGNHSDTHPYFTRLSAQQIRGQLGRAEDAITRACGRGARPLFRYPYGDSNDRTRSVVASAGYQAVGWTLDSLDGVGKPKSAAFVDARIIHHVRPGYIVLMHVSYPETARSLPAILAYLDGKGIQVVPVSSLLYSHEPPHGLQMASLRH